MHGVDTPTKYEQDINAFEISQKGAI